MFSIGLWTSSKTSSGEIVFFEDVEWYYAEEGRYIIHVKARDGITGHKPEQFRIVKASNPDQAIAFACFDLGLKNKEEKNHGDD